MRLTPFAYDRDNATPRPTSQDDKGRPGGLDNKMKTDDQQKEEILARTDMIELCDALGLAPKGKVARCPARAGLGHHGHEKLAAPAPPVQRGHESLDR